MNLEKILTAIDNALQNTAVAIDNACKPLVHKAKIWGYTFKTLDADKQSPIIGKTIAAAGAGIVGAVFFPAATGLFMLAGGGFAFKHCMDSLSLRDQGFGLAAYVKDNPEEATEKAANYLADKFNNGMNKVSNMGNKIINIFSSKLR